MLPRTWKCIGLVLVLVFSASSLHAQDLQTVVAMGKLKTGNARFVEEKLKGEKNLGEKRKQLAKGQKPFAIILTCADSRVAPEYVFDQGLGELFTLRVAGNIAGQGMIGSMEYAVEHLHCPLIVVMGHESCGAVKAALETKPGDIVDSNLSWLVKQVDVGKDLPKDPKEAVTAGVKHNAIRQAQLLVEKSTVIKEFVQSKRVQIVPAYYALDTGKVEWLDLPKLTGKHPAYIRVIVPHKDARIWLDDTETQSRGLMRTFEVPPVDAEREYSYQVKAEWPDMGFKAMETRKVSFKGGMTVTVDFTKAAPK